MGYPILPPYDNSRGTSRIVDLMLRQGESRAQDVATRGDIWGNAIANIGQNLGQSVQDYYGRKAYEKEQQAAKDEERAAKDQETAQRAEQDAFLVKWIDRAEAGEKVSPSDLVPVFGAERAAKLAEAYGAAKTQPTDPVAALNQLTSLSNGWEAMNPEARAMMYPVFRALGLQNPVIRPLAEQGQVELPEQYTPETADAINSMFGSFAKKLPRDTKVVDGKLVDAQTGEVVFEAPPEEPDPLEEENQRLQNEKLKADIQRLRADPEKPAPRLEDVDKLAQRWSKATEASRSIDRQVKIMDEGLISARKGDLAAGSQAILITFQKILDPESVVRESEYARSAAGQSAIARAEGVIDRLSRGGAGVPIAELEKFAELAKRMAKAGATGFLYAEKQRLGRLADEYNIKRDLIFPDYDFTPPEEESNPFRQGGATANPFRGGQ